MGDRPEIDRLLRNAESGDEAAVRRLVALAAQGREDALQALVRALKDRGKKTNDAPECSWTREAGKEIWRLKTLANEQPLDAWDAADEALHLDYGACYVAQVLGTKAQILRCQRRFPEAEALLNEALDIAGSCRYAVVDLNRRLGILRMEEGRYPEALHLLNEALREYEAMPGPGHDPNGNGVASCHFARGEPLHHMGDFEAAAADWRRCLTMFSPVDQQDMFVYSVINLARALFDGGLQCPTRELNYARQYFRGTRKASVPRATFNWLDGQVRFESGDRRRRSRWRDNMIWARDDFFELRLYDEASAVAADVALTWLKSRTRLRTFLERTLERMDNADEVLRQQLKKIQKTNDADTDFQFYANLEAAIRGLRKLTADRTSLAMPCLVTSPRKT